MDVVLCATDAVRLTSECTASTRQVGMEGFGEVWWDGPSSILCAEDYVEKDFG